MSDGIFPDDCGFFNSMHFDPFTGMYESWIATRSAICWEFIIGLIIVIAVTLILRPPCFAVWIVIIGCYLVISVLTKMISIVVFGVLFSLLYLIDRSLAVNLECKDKDEEDDDDDDEDDEDDNNEDEDDDEED